MNDSSSRTVALRHNTERTYRSLASRTPLNCQRVAGGKKFRYVARMCDGGVTHDPPRSTIWPDMNFPLYSPSGPGGGV